MIEITLVIYHFFEKKNSWEKSKESIGFYIAKNYLKFENTFSKYIGSLHCSLKLLEEMIEMKKVENIVELSFW